MGNWAYEYDKRGNLIGISDRGKRVRAYEYDITGRLGLSYSKSGKARSYSYDGLGNRIGFKEYEKQIGYGEDGIKNILGANLSELTPSYEENYILNRTRAYHNLLQRRTGKKGVQAIQNYVWDFNVAYMEEGEKEFTYLQDELGSIVRLLEQGEESQTIYGMEAINATGVLTAVIDKPNHVSVRPVNPLEMMEWINSRPTAKENPYYLTKILASISIRDNGGPCNVKID